jgi:hypothetical protein
MKSKIVFWLIADLQIDGDGTETYEIVGKPIPKELLDFTQLEQKGSDLDWLLYSMVKDLNDDSLYGNRDMYELDSKID